MEDEDFDQHIAPTQAAAMQALLHRSAHAGDLDGARAAIQNGADVNAWHEQTGLAALHFAVGTNNLPLVRYLLEEAGADLMPDRSGRWPTVIAAECRVDEALCDYIVDREAACTQD